MLSTQPLASEPPAAPPAPLPPDDRVLKMPPHIKNNPTHVSTAACSPLPSPSRDSPSRTCKWEQAGVTLIMRGSLWPEVGSAGLGDGGSSGGGGSGGSMLINLAALLSRHGGKAAGWTTAAPLQES